MENSKINELASKLNEMKNPLRLGISVGTVTSVSPFSVSIAGGAVLLIEGDELFVCENLKKRKYKAVIGKDETIITIDPEITTGNKVLVVPTDNEQTWIAVDRIGG